MNKKLTTIVCAATLTLMIGGTFAYLTDSDQKINNFTVGKVTIDLTEPSWKPEENTELTPMQEIEKDPQITNTGKNKAYVFMEVSIPKKELVLADASGNRLPAAVVPLFTYEANEGWELISTNSNTQSDTYTYAYDQILSPEETTETLFDTITFQNVVEGQIDGASFEIPVNAYAIQSDHTGDDKDSVVEQAKAAFEKYQLQNAKENTQEGPSTENNQNTQEDQNMQDNQNGSGALEQP